jgi:hypothetical protein
LSLNDSKNLKILGHFEIIEEYRWDRVPFKLKMFGTISHLRLNEYEKTKPPMWGLNHKINML